jgi:hypothetical protein
MATVCGTWSSAQSAKRNNWRGPPSVAREGRRPFMPDWCLCVAEGSARCLHQPKPPYLTTLLPTVNSEEPEIRVHFVSEWQQEFTTSTGEIEPVILRSGRAQALSNAKDRYLRGPSAAGVKRPGRYKSLWHFPWPIEVQVLCPPGALPGKRRPHPQLANHQPATKTCSCSSTHSKKGGCGRVFTDQASARAWSNQTSINRICSSWCSTCTEVSPATTTLSFCSLYGLPNHLSQFFANASTFALSTITRS